MENYRKSLFPLLGVAFLMVFAVSVHAQTGEETQAAIMEDEAAGVSEVTEEAVSTALPVATEAQPDVTEQVSVSPVQEAVALQTPEMQPAVDQASMAPQAIETQPALIQETVTPQWPEAQSAIVQEPVVPQAPETQLSEYQEPGIEQVPEVQPAVVPEPVVPQVTETQHAVPEVIAAQEAPAAEAVPPVAEEIISPTPNPSGVMQVSGYKYPVYLYAPKDYKTDRTYSLIMIAPAESENAQEQIDYLTGLAQRNSIFILSPHVLWPKSGDTPYELDKWLLDVKKDVVDRFPINRKRVYLVGKNSGAHYAAYLATEHAEEFTAAALFGEAWDGPFSQLIKASSDPARQVPFYIALKTGSDAKPRNQAWFDKLQKKGYWLYLTEYPAEGTLDELEFKKAAYDWLEEASQSWIAAAAKSHQGWKGRFKKGFRDFFTV